MQRRGQVARPQRTFPRAAVAAVLTHDFFARHDKCWRLVEEAELAELSAAIAKDPFSWGSDVKACGHSSVCGLRMEADYVEWLKKRFTHLPMLFEAAGEHLLLAGGSLVSTLTSAYGSQCDADFFFVGQTVEKAQALLELLVAMLTAADADASVFLTRNAVTVVDCQENRYQFVLRNYATVSHVLGGFDLSCCGVGWTPKTGLVATPLAALSLCLGSAIVDVSRRSPSFELRLLKYAQDKGITIVFPGAKPDKDFDLNAGYKMIMCNDGGLRLTGSKYWIGRHPRSMDEVLTSGSEVLADYGTSDYTHEIMVARNIALACAGKDGLVMECKSLTDRSTYRGEQSVLVGLSTAEFFLARSCGSR